MKRQVSAGSALLYFTACFYFAFQGLSTIEALTACSKDHPGNAECREINAECFIERNNYTCQCSTGYWMFEGRCQKSDWCADREIGDLICKSNGTICKALEWASNSPDKRPFKCECESMVVTSGICSVTNRYCQNRGSRPFTHNNITLCECEEEHFFDYSVSKCQYVDLCPFTQCRGKYEKCHGGECVCEDSYMRENKYCTPRKYCDLSTQCGSAKCEEGPADDPRNVRCYCDKGYVLEREAGVPYCKLVRCESRSLNSCDQICRYAPDKKSTSCACFPGHTLKPDNYSCELLPLHKCAYNICKSKSVCVKIDGEETCLCQNSYVGFQGEETCLDRCRAGSFQQTVCPDKCRSTDDGFRCICEGKYKRSRDNVTCEERQMCFKGEEGFRNCSQKNRACIERPETEEGFQCGVCLYGLQDYKGDCTDLCQVEENIHYCEERGGICISVSETTHEVRCKCRPLLVWRKNVGCVFANHSYTGQLRINNSYEDTLEIYGLETLVYGEGKLDWKKLDHDLSKSMLTVFGQALSEINVLHCRYDEDCITCAVELQLHFRDYGILGRLNSRNICRGRNKVPSKFCFIPPYLKLVPTSRTTENVEAPFLRSDVCDIPYGSSMCPSSTDCIPEDVGFSCRCKMGFRRKTAVFLNVDKTGIIEICHDRNECEEMNPCPNGTVCLNTVGGFECPCAPGLFRQNISGDPKVDMCTGACDGVMCIHGICESHDLGFYCRCDSEHRGLYCEEYIPSNETHTGDKTKGIGYTVIIAVGAVEAVIFFCFVMLCIISCAKSRRHRESRTTKYSNGTRATHTAAVQQRTRDDTRNHIQLKTTTIVEPSGRFRESLEEDPDEPIYADCTQIT